MVGKLLWLANTTRPDLAYAAAYLSRTLAGPTDRDFQLADRCIAYTKSTADYCLVIPKINWDKAQISVITDASWAAPRDDYKSQSGYLVLLHDHLHCGLLAWKSTMLRKMAGSSMASECFSAQSGWQMGLHLRALINGMSPGKQLLQLRCTTDNDDLYKAVKIRKRSVPKDRSLTLSVYILRECADLDRVTLCFVPGLANPADALTKPLSDMDNLIKLMRGEASNLGQEADPMGPKREAKKKPTLNS